MRTAGRCVQPSTSNVSHRGRKIIGRRTSSEESSTMEEPRGHGATGTQGSHGDTEIFRVVDVLPNRMQCPHDNFSSSPPRRAVYLFIRMNGCVSCHALSPSFDFQVYPPRFKFPLYCYLPIRNMSRQPGMHRILSCLPILRKRCRTPFRGGGRLDILNRKPLVYLRTLTVSANLLNESTTDPPAASGLQHDPRSNRESWLRADGA